MTSGSLREGHIGTWLRAEGASQDIAGWADGHGSDWAGLWTGCPRGDWMLAIAGRLGVDARLLAVAARSVASLAVDVLPDGDPAPGSLERLESRTEAELSAVGEALERRSSEAGDPAVAAALLALASVARTALDPSAAAMAAALTTQALVMDAGECAMMSVLGWSQRSAADRVREAIPLEILLAALASR